MGVRVRVLGLGLGLGYAMASIPCSASSSAAKRQKSAATWQHGDACVLHVTECVYRECGVCATIGQSMGATVCVCVCACHGCSKL